MADEKEVKVKVTVEDNVEPSIARLRELKQEIKKVAAGSEDFRKLKAEMNDVEDAINSAKAGAGNFTEILGQIPGPIGDIGTAASTTIDTLKSFGQMKFGDIKKSFGDLKNDVEDAFKGLGKLTGITKLYTGLNNILAKSFKGLATAEGEASAGAKALSGALIATGIGALVVLLGVAFEALKEFATGEKEAAAEAEKLNNAINTQNAIFELDQESRRGRNQKEIAELKQNGATQAQIRKKQLEQAKSDIDFYETNRQEAAKTYNEAMAKGDKDAYDKASANLTKFEVLKTKAQHDAETMRINNATDDAKDSLEQQKKNLDASIALELEKQSVNVKNLESYYKQRVELEKINSDGTHKSQRESAEIDKKYEKLKDDAVAASIQRNADLKQSEKDLADFGKTSGVDVLQNLQARRKIEDENYKAKKTALEDERKQYDVNSQEYAKYTQQINALDLDYLGKKKEINDSIVEEDKKRYDKVLEINLNAVDVNSKAEIDAIKKAQAERGYAILDEDAKIAEIQKENAENRLFEIKNNKQQEKDFLKTQLDQGLIDQQAYNQGIYDIDQEYFDLELNATNTFNDAVVASDEAAAKAKIDIAKATQEAKQAILMAEIDNYAAAGQLLQQIAGKNKGLAIAGLVIEQGAAIAKIHVSAMAARALFAASVAPLGPLGVPLSTAYSIQSKIGEALGIASAIAATVMGIQQITSADTSGGGSAGGSSAPAPTGSKFGKGGLLTGKSHSQGGVRLATGDEAEGGEFIINKRSTASFMPLLSAINSAGNGKYADGGMTGNLDEIKNMLSNQSMPIVKTYVVASDVTNQAEADAKIARLARI